MSTATTDEQRRLYIREFLNNQGHHGLGAVLAEINDGDASDDYLDFGATLQIQDCSRSVTLDFGVYGQTNTEEDRDQLRKDLENARAKADRLKGAVYLFIEKLDEALSDVETDLDERDRKAKKKNKKAKKAAKKG
ncbi:hypothetical protein [Streptomyces sp. NPDC091879]|jgi:hypothetical protein|uniref:hypothetical protein n=1 Tax=Streptomyces sp. NPDC091879 TaxID=3366006 RepID=UPI0037FF98C9